MDVSIDEVIEGRTVTTAFRATVEAYGESVALRWPQGTDWQVLRWGEYAERAARVAAGLRDLGVERGQRVLLMLRNRPEFHLADMAALLLGAIPVSIYNSSAPEQIRYFAAHSGARVAIVDSPEFLERFLNVRGDLPDLRHLVIVEDPEHLAPVDAVDFARLLERSPLDWRANVDAAKPDDLVTVIYTSGTTGPPKGVMITHRNACWTVESLVRAFGREITGKRMISYLPMAHIAERMTTHYIHVDQGTDVATCPDPELLPGCLREVRPEVFFAVPRVWEKMRSSIEAGAAADLERLGVFHRAVELGAQAFRARMADQVLAPDTQREFERAEATFLSALRVLIGLDQCEIAVSAAAPIPRQVIEFFLAIGVPISELYGLSESCGPLTWDPYRVRPGTVGRAIPGCRVRLAPDGEVLGRGGNVFVGYLNDPDKTADVIDTEGWLHTGDVGTLDDDAYLTIVDRKKELIITAGGENISPSGIEAGLCASPLISQACVIGDRRPYLVALVTLDPEVSFAWARNQDIEAATLADLARHPLIRQEVQHAVDDLNRNVFRIGQIKRFTILDHDWSIDSEVLTPTMKLKRRTIHEKYATEIDALYTAPTEEFNC